MTLWTFGDSFAQHEDNTPDQWMQIISTQLQIDSVTLGLNGSSLEYVYHQFNNNRTKIKENDIIILVLTGLHRRWHFKDHPGHNRDTLPDEYTEDKSIKFYKEYLANSDVHNVYLLNFLYNVHSLTKKLNLHTIVMSDFLDTHDLLRDKRNSFPRFNIANGTLTEVSMYEYTYEYYDKLYQEGNLNFSNLVDIRLNHLLRCNHLILADKIINNIKNNSAINLSGFHKHLMSDQAIKDPTFVKDQLFGRII